jgi:hypothetical protein
VPDLADLTHDLERAKIERKLAEEHAATAKAVAQRQLAPLRELSFTLLPWVPAAALLCGYLKWSDVWHSASRLFGFG